MALDTTELRRILGPTLQYVAGKLDVATSILSTIATAVRDASGDIFTIDDIEDGEYLVRVGSTITGGSPTPGGPPTGSAGGDLGSTYPNPTVTAVHETSGPTKLTLGAVADGQLLGRSGSTLVGVTPAAAGVTSFNTRSGAVTAQSGDYTAAQVGAISSAAAGISGLTAKASPASGDSIPINDGAASNALKKIDVSTLPYVPITIITRTGNPWLDTPASPNAWNDEFNDSGSADLATRGWAIRLAASPYTLLTRAGGIDYTDDGLTSFASGTYRSDVVGSVLRLQVKQDVTISKAVSGVGTYVARAYFASMLNSQGTASVTANQLLWGITDRTVGSQTLWNAGGIYSVIGLSGSSSGIDITSGWTAGNHSSTQANAYVSSISDFSYDVMGQCLRTGFDIFGFLGLSAVQRIGWRAGRAQSATVVPTAAFLFISPTVGASSTTYFKPSWVEIDYFRLLPATGWFG